MAFHIKVTSPTKPGVTGVVGGKITVTDNGDGTWELTSSDVITAFKMGDNREDITRLEVIEEELTECDNTFNGLTNMVEFVAPTSSFSSVTFFDGCWYGSSSLKEFPVIDTSLGKSFEGTWALCSSLTKFPSLDTSSGVRFPHTWGMCSNLRCIEGIDFSSADPAAIDQVFVGCPNLCRPNPQEIQDILNNRIKWVSDVPYNRDCCPRTSTIHLGDNKIDDMYLGDTKINGSLGDKVVI